MNTDARGLIPVSIDFKVDSSSISFTREMDVSEWAKPIRGDCYEWNEITCKIWQVDKYGIYYSYEWLEPPPKDEKEEKVFEKAWPGADFKDVSATIAAGGNCDDCDHKFVANTGHASMFIYQEDIGREILPTWRQWFLNQPGVVERTRVGSVFDVTLECETDNIKIYRKLKRR